jgi:hypothetical protein
MDPFYPHAGLLKYLFGSAQTPFEDNRFSDYEDAAGFCTMQNDYQSEFGIQCRVVDEYSREQPVYRWRCMCSL